MYDVHRICMQICTIILNYSRLFWNYSRLFAIFLHNLHSHHEEIGTENLICIRIAKKFGSPNIPRTSSRLRHCWWSPSPGSRWMVIGHSDYAYTNIDNLWSSSLSSLRIVIGHYEYNNTNIDELRSTRTLSVFSPPAFLSSAPLLHFIWVLPPAFHRSVHPTFHRSAPPLHFIGVSTLHFIGVLPPCIP